MNGHISVDKAAFSVAGRVVRVCRSLEDVIGEFSHGCSLPIPGLCGKDKRGEEIIVCADVEEAWVKNGISEVTATAGKGVSNLISFGPRQMQAES